MPKVTHSKSDLEGAIKIVLESIIYRIEKCKHKNDIPLALDVLMADIAEIKNSLNNYGGTVNE